MAQVENWDSWQYSYDKYQRGGAYYYDDYHQSQLQKKLQKKRAYSLEQRRILMEEAASVTMPKLNGDQSFVPVKSAETFPKINPEPFIPKKKTAMDLLDEKLASRLKRGSTAIAGVV